MREIDKLLVDNKLLNQDVQNLTKKLKMTSYFIVGLLVFFLGFLMAFNKGFIC